MNGSKRIRSTVKCGPSCCPKPHMTVEFSLCIDIWLLKIWNTYHFPSRQKQYLLTMSPAPRKRWSELPPEKKPISLSESDDGKRKDDDEEQCRQENAATRKKLAFHPFSV